MVDQLTMPVIGINQCEFNLRTVDAVNNFVSGAGVSDSIAPDFWEVSLSTVPCQRGTERYKAWSAFYDGLRGSKRIALLFDPEAQYPQAYGSSVLGLGRVGGGTFDGTAEIDARTNPRQFQISTLPENFTLSRGDYVSFVKGDRRWLTRIIEDVTGNVATIKVEPAVPSLYDASATVNVVRALGEFIQLPQTLNRPRTVGQGGPFSARFRSRIF
jgi:hypothetical protein